MNAVRRLDIVHLTVYRDLPAGIRKQIGYEREAAGHLEDANWTSLAVHAGVPREAFESRIPWMFRPILLRSLYGWLVVLRLSRRHDFVLLRHMTFDPFALMFAPLARNRISVHHSKEVEELPLIRRGIGGRIAAAVERITGRAAVRHARGVLGVTPEIARYEVDTRAPGKPCGSYPNGIRPGEVRLLEDARDATAVSVAFIAETFSEWHGLDRLVDAVRDAGELPDALHIHLIGRVSDALRARIGALGPRESVFRLLGFLDTENYRRVLAECDVGVGSLAMDRQKMSEGSTLKVREMLASGLPVYSGHRDPSFPGDFPYYHEAAAVDLDGLVRFALAMKSSSRAAVREASAPHVDKLSGMRQVVAWLQGTFAARQGT